MWQGKSIQIIHLFSVILFLFTFSKCILSHVADVVNLINIFWADDTQFIASNVNQQNIFKQIK